MNFEPVPTSSSYARRPAQADSGVASFLWTTYRWMALGLALTGLTAWAVAHVPALTQLIFANRMVFFGLIIAEFALVMTFSVRVAQVSAGAAAAMFLGYSVLNGLTLASLFLVYTHASLTQAFLVSSASFAALSVFGATTQRDLSAMQQFLFVGLIGFVLASGVNLFFHNPAVYCVSTYAGVLVFAGLTAYDNQRLKQMYTLAGGGGNLAINGALQLYLDFVNMFLLVLRFFGDRR